MLFNFVEISNTINKRFEKNIFDILFVKYFLPPGNGSGSNSKWTLTQTYNRIRNIIQLRIRITALVLLGQ